MTISLMVEIWEALEIIFTSGTLKRFYRYLIGKATQRSYCGELTLFHNVHMTTPTEQDKEEEQMEHANNYGTMNETVIETLENNAQKARQKSLKEHKDLSYDNKGFINEHERISIEQNQKENGSYKEDKEKDKSTQKKISNILWVLLRLVLILASLYVFICSLDVLQESLHLLSGRSAGELFKNNILINNPVSGMMIGVFVTVIVQSSSTSSSIVVALVAAGLLTVHQSIPIIMGTNIGTTVTNTIVALTQSSDRQIFSRSFAGATVHDAFNWLTVIVLLPLETITHYLYELTNLLTKNIHISSSGDNPQFLKVITTPLTNLIIQVDKKVITAIAKDSDRQKFPLAKYWSIEALQDFSVFLFAESCNNTVEEIKNNIFSYNVVVTIDYNEDCILNYTKVIEENSTKAVHMFVGAGLEGYISEVASGTILLIASLVVMTTCLIGMVKILNSLFKGAMAGVVKNVLNAELPGFLKYFTGYVVMLVAVGMTILFQSSSVFTSALTPLVGLGLLEVERMYPLTLGSNIGTTVTSLLAAFTADADKIRDAIQVSLCHLFFNFSGILIFYVIPFMRVPIPIAISLGNITGQYRWFAIFYLIAMFLCLPLFIFLLSLAGPEVLMGVGIPLLVILVVVIVINIIQNRKPSLLPPFLRTWDFLPLPLHSLEPLDRVISTFLCCPKKHSDDDDDGGEGGEKDVSGKKFEDVATKDNGNVEKDDENNNINNNTSSGDFVKNDNSKIHGAPELTHF